MKYRIKKMNFFKLIAAIVILFLLSFSLITLVKLPLKGIADNGDFWRVMNAAGLAHTGSIETFKFDYVQRHFSYSEIELKDFISTASIAALLARTVSHIATPRSEYFDLRILGIFYFCLLSLSIYILTRSPVPIVLSAGVLWVIADPNYLLFFNSFYAEPMIIISAVGMLAILINWKSIIKHVFQKPKLVLFFTGLFIGGTALLGGLTKQQYMLVPGILLLCLSSGKFIFFSASLKKYLYLLLPLFIVSIIVPLFYSFPGKNSPLKYLSQINNFNCVFYGIVKASSNPERALRTLNIPQSYWSYKGKNYFEMDESDFPQDLKDALENLSRIKVFFLYLTDPRAAFEAFKGVQGAMKVSRLRYPGHFSGEAGLGRAEYRVPWQFSNFRDKIFNKIPFLSWLIIGSAVFWLGYRAFLQRRWSCVQIVELFFLSNILSQMVISIFGDGLFGLPRHLILARLCLDLLAFFLIFDIASSIYARLDPNFSNRQSRDQESP